MHAQGARTHTQISAWFQLSADSYISTISYRILRKRYDFSPIISVIAELILPTLLILPILTPDIADIDTKKLRPILIPRDFKPYRCVSLCKPPTEPTRVSVFFLFASLYTYMHAQTHGPTCTLLLTNVFLSLSQQTKCTPKTGIRYLLSFAAHGGSCLRTSLAIPSLLTLPIA